MIQVRSRLRYAGPPKFAGRLRSGDEVLHLVSDAGTEAVQRAELRAFVADAGLPCSLLNSPHFLGPGRPHLDVWGSPARKAARFLGSGEQGRPDVAALGRTGRKHQLGLSSGNPRTST